MPVVKCPHCQQPMTIPANAAGRKAACPHCRKPMMIPGAAPAAATSPPKARAPVARPAMPPPKSPKKAPWAIIAGAGGAGVVLLVVTALLLSRPAPKVENKTWNPEDKYVAKVDPAPVVPKKGDPKTDQPPEDPPPGAATITAQMAAALEQINAMRTAAKLKPVAVDADLSRGCQAHAEYVVRNLASMTTAAALNTEDAGRPGYSDAGRDAAQVSLITRVDPKTTADYCLGRIAIRGPLMHPQLERIGLGTHVSAKREWATVLDANRGHGIAFVTYPARGQKDVPLAFSGGPEGPAGAGFPVTLQFHPSRPLGGLEASIADENGNQLDSIRWTPDKSPAPFRAGMLGILPKNRLLPKTTYRARVAGVIDDRPFDTKWEFTTEDDGDDDGARAEAVLERVNAIRRQAGLAEVKLDDALSRGCRAHAKYLAINSRRPETQGLGAHEEEPSLPGFTPEGKLAGKASDIALGDYEPLDAVAGWMATLYHRVPILEPNLQTVGFGCARGDRLGWITVLDLNNGLDKSKPRPAPVIYPAENQADVPLDFPPGGETPNPIPEDTTGKAGYPITVFFPRPVLRPTDVAKPLKAAAKLEDARGREVGCWFSSPESPANPMFEKHQGTTVCLIPKEPLQPEHRYRATFVAEPLGAPWRKSWTFTTTKKVAEGSAVQTALDRFNAVRAIAGLPPVQQDPKQAAACQAHADYLAMNPGKTPSVNDEDPSLPGFTPAGRTAARNAAIFSKAPRTSTQIDDLLAGISFRGFFLDPKLRKVGLGCSRETGAGWINVLGLRGVREEAEPITCPASGQDNVPTEGRDRLPDDPKSPAGFPITVWFPGHPSIKNVRATLAESTRLTVDIWLSTPDAPFDATNPLRDVIAIHPRRPLKAGSIYTVNITADVGNTEWVGTWRFSTAK